MVLIFRITSLCSPGTDISRNSRLVGALIGLMNTLGLTRPLRRSAQGILYAATVPLHPVPATTRTHTPTRPDTDVPAAGDSAEEEHAAAGVGRCDGGYTDGAYSAYYDDGVAVAPHASVVDLHATSLAWRGATEP
jgi:hypothetical protein